MTITGLAPTSVLGRAFSHVVVPIQRGASSVTQWIGGRIDVLIRSDQILAENQALRDENARLRAESDRLAQLDAESIHLHNLLNMAQRYPELNIEGARLLGQNPNNWHSSFFINKGSNQGVRPNMIVLGEYGGVLGVIHQVGPNYAQVVTIMDTRFAAAARNARTEDVGTVWGDRELSFDRLMRMENIEAGARFMPGDIILTSEHGAFFPPGLTLGTIVDVQPNADGLTQHAIIQPAASLDRIDFVLVVMDLFYDAPDMELFEEASQ